MAERSFVRAALVIARGEVQRLARDHRALFAGVLLPALIYPLFFHGQSWLRSLSDRALSGETVHVALDLGDAPADVAGELAGALRTSAGLDVVDVASLPHARAAAEELRALAPRLHEGQPDAVARRDRLTAGLLEQGLDALVSAQEHPVLPARCVLRVFHDGSEERSREALRRIEGALAGVDDQVRAGRIGHLLGESDPARGLDTVEVDLATVEDTGGATLGRLLPLLAVLVLISGGSFAALSVFAGEREAGTLETLLVQPLPAAAVAWGKFYAVLAVSLAALCCNVGSLLASLALGLGALPGVDPEQGSAVVLAAGSGRLGVAALVFLPTAVLLSGLLSLISTRARTFREGQQLLLPLTLAAAIPAGVAGLTDVPLDAILAATPLLGPCLAARDALRGSLAVWPGAVAVGSGVAWAALALRALAEALSNEHILQQGDTRLEAGQRRLSARTALGFGLTAALGSYALGGWLQARLGLAGLLLTLWGFLPLMALFCARRLRERTGRPLLASLALRSPRPGHVVGALLLAPGLAAAMRSLVALQERVAPLPARLLEAGGEQFAFLEALSPLQLFLVLAFSPGVCEELFFRGPLLSGLRRDLGPARAVVWQALLFGAAHASLHRFLPTAGVGLLLGALTLRSRSLVPAILLHVGYDGFQVLAATVPWTGEPSLTWLALPGAWLLVRSPAPARTARAALASAA